MAHFPSQVVCAIALLALLAGCDGYPRDADDMTQKAADVGMYVGASHDPPYVRVSAEGEVTGTEVAPVERFANERGYRVIWATDAHDALMLDLENAQLHAVIGGHHPDSPWKPKVGWSRTLYLREGGNGALHQRRIALPPGQSAWHLAFDRHLVEREGAQ